MFALFPKWNVWFFLSFKIIFVTLLAVCRGAKLDNTYLPPPDAQSSGGDFGSGLAPPNQGNNNNGNNGFNNGNNNNNNNFGQPQNGFGQNPPQQQGGGGGGGGSGPGGFQPQESQQPPIAIISYDNEPNYGDGSYKYSYETGMYTLLGTMLLEHYRYFQALPYSVCGSLWFFRTSRWLDIFYAFACCVCIFSQNFRLPFVCEYRKWHQSSGTRWSQK